jgi:spore maturation protein CgeB
MRILFIGDLNEYGRSFQRYRTLKELGHEVVGLSHTPVPFRPGIDKSNLLERIMWKLKLPLDLTLVNRKIREAVTRGIFDIVWIEKGNTVRPATLRFIRKANPRTKLVSCSEDDMYAKHNQSLYYLRGLRYYDIAFTTKVYNLEELKLLGAKRTALFLDAYDEKTHRPMELTVEERQRFGCDVGFIGSFERDRAEKMLFLAEQGISVVVWGNGWGDWTGRSPNLVIRNAPLYEDDYAKAINATKINLCFLRKINRDEVTSRSVEIPACGGFMIAERTKRHLEFFEEGREAVFFDTQEELLDMVRTYLKDDEARKRIAEAGRVRCLTSGYNHRAQLQKMLQIAHAP